MEKLPQLTNVIAYGGGDPNTLVLDLKNFQDISYYDTINYTAKVGAGSLLGNISNWMAANGNRAFAHGICPQVGSTYGFLRHILRC
jgi:hypothetical protein